MKKLLVLAALLAGCSTTGTLVQPTPQQVVAQFCPVVEAINAQVLVLPGLDPAIATKIAAAQAIVTPVCAQGATLATTDLQNLSTQAIPLLLDAVSATAIATTPQGQAIVLGLNIANITISQIIAAQK